VAVAPVVQVVVALVVEAAGRRGQEEGEAGAGGVRARRGAPDVAAVEADVLADQGEAQPGAAVGPPVAGLRAAGEALEDQLALLARHARTLVLHTDLDAAVHLV